MAKENKPNYLWIGLAVIAVIVLAIVFISNSNKNVSNEVTCNSPYIKVGTSCCLDQNSNGICDNEEQTQEAQKNSWALNDFSVYGGTSEDFTGCSQGMKVYNNLNNLGNTGSKNIQLALFHQYAGEPEGYGMTYQDYQTAVLIGYVDYNTNFYDDYEGVTCEISEYYDGVFQEINTQSFKHNYGLPEDKYGFFMELFYKQTDKPSEAKYIISCKGDTSGREVKKTFRFNIDYADKVITTKC